jgi:hypothetical protein
MHVHQRAERAVVASVPFLCPKIAIAETSRFVKHDLRMEMLEAKTKYQVKNYRSYSLLLANIERARFAESEDSSAVWYKGLETVSELAKSVTSITILSQFGNRFTFLENRHRISNGPLSINVRLLYVCCLFCYF